jgi:hypothetical protein
VNNTMTATCAQVEGVYQGNGTSCDDPCRFRGTGDGDGDGDVDKEDHSSLVDCLAGPGVAYPDFDCFPFDSDNDGDVDAVDVRAFQNAFGD